MDGVAENQLIRFYFALTSRMRSFLELRGALDALQTAEQHNDGRAWLHAACDLRASWLGDQGRPPALPELIGLLLAMQDHLAKLAKDMPQYQARIDQICRTLEQHALALKPGFPELDAYLTQDALINAYLNTQKKQDWLAQRIGLQQTLPALWQGMREQASWIRRQLEPVIAASDALDQMFNDYVRWEKRSAENGRAQITPERESQHGLLVIGLAAEDVARGIMPNVSGNKLAICLRFQRWLPGRPPEEHTEDQAFAMMLVPVG